MKLKNNFLAYSLLFIFLMVLTAPNVLHAEEAAPIEPVTTEQVPTTEPTEPSETIPTPETTQTPVTTETQPDTETQNAITDTAPAVTTDTTSTTPTITTTTIEFVTEANTTTSTTSTTTESTVQVPVVADTAKLTIRLDDTIVFSGAGELKTTTTTVTDNQGVTHGVAGNSVLGLLYDLDAGSALFDISDLAYFASFDSFLINCIKAGETPSCYNWQYTVNDIYPFVGIDKYVLQNNDDIYLYFGNQNQFTLSTTTVELGDPLTIKTEKYDYRDNAWVPRPNVTVGGTRFDPANPWTPIVVTSTLANDLGIATLYFTATGTLDIGIGDDYYYPTQTVTIIDAVTTTTETTTMTEATPAPASSGDGGGSSSSNSVVTTPTLDIAKAIEFLGTQQNQATGAIGSATLYSDWAAIALGSHTSADNIKTKLLAYLQTDPNPGTAATDYERRAMALMALGVNPYSGTKTNYINEILKTYQGNQFGDNGLVNDDIFALFPLLKAGYTTADAEIQNSVAFILSRQNPTGGWDSPDMTAAAVQALSQVKSLAGVNDALTKAKDYLKASAKADGRIGDNSFSTSWGAQAIAALGESVSSWNGTNDSPLTYLAKQQQNDGGLESTASTMDNRIWSTSYAIPAGQNKIWSDILVSFSKPIVSTNPTPSSGSGGGIIIPVETSTSTPAATSTPVIITIPTSTTSTVEILVPTPEPKATKIIEPIVTEPTVGTVTEEITTTPVLKNSTPQPRRLVVSTENAPVQVVANNTSKQLTIAPSQNTPVSSNRRAAGGAATVAGTAAAYLAWRFLQSLV